MATSKNKNILCRVYKHLSFEGNRYYDVFFPLYEYNSSAASLETIDKDAYEDTVYRSGITIWDTYDDNSKFYNGQYRLLQYDPSKIEYINGYARLSNHFISDLSFSVRHLFFLDEDRKKDPKTTIASIFADIEVVYRSNKNIEDGIVVDLVKEDNSIELHTAKIVGEFVHNADKRNPEYREYRKNQEHLWEKDENVVIVKVGGVYEESQPVLPSSSEQETGLNENAVIEWLENRDHIDETKTIVQLILESHPELKAEVISALSDKERDQLQENYNNELETRKRIEKENETLKDENEKFQKIYGSIQDLEEKEKQAKRSFDETERNRKNKQNELENVSKSLDRIKNENTKEEEKAKRIKETGDAYINQLTERAKKPVSVIADSLLQDKVVSLVQHAINNSEDEQKNGTENGYQRAISSIAYTRVKEIPSGKSIVDMIYSDIKRCRNSYEPEQIYNIMLCTMLGFITVFSGNPGTGKTSMCNIVAKVLGLKDAGSKREEILSCHIDTRRFIHIQVERGWTTKRDWIGYYNPLTKEFDRSNSMVFDALNILDYEAENKSDTILPSLMLLDEANLSPMEHYWGEFIDACDKVCDGHESTINLGDNYVYRIPENLRFVATINNDHTTEALSPRLIDRAWIIRLPDNISPSPDDCDPDNMGIMTPYTWKSIRDAFIPTSDELSSYHLSTGSKIIYDCLKDWIKGKARPATVASKLEKGAVIPVTADISPRIDKAIIRYCASAAKISKNDGKNKRMPELMALDYAISQRILPHVIGNGPEFGQNLHEIAEWCRNNSLHQCQKILEVIEKKGRANMHYYRFFG